MTTPNTSIDIALDVPGGVCSITSQPLDVQQIVKYVGPDNAAGATAVFIGRTITRLEYQAYSKLAIKTMASIIQDARQSLTCSEHHPESQSSLIHCVVHHRIGVVPVGEPSIEAFVACGRILEEVKQKAQIWKREYYEGIG
ncbi:Molybdopterin biosynthesis MoaE [Desarmillaria tabescens]|uniref:Molybdopterin biosynthesis MoaE n=1 Tax=Armillaria tabescens TaxID=1929756 RepID=A0AA39JQ18_ARMTA|nr:Molybdopterin biosynthesis MoaE [Desarmillaria tabescens]KAK0446382.1 Molybdopterin biosynthesis MoaE [Desarmillaria tabescens]